MTNATPHTKAIAFTKVPNEWLEFLAEGQLDPLALTILIILHKQADYSTGYWNGCAYRLLLAVGDHLSLRAIQYRLQFLEDAGFLSSTHERGKRGSYRVVLNNYVPTSGANKGTLLRPTQITSAIPKWLHCEANSATTTKPTVKRTANPTSSLSPDCEADSEASAKASANGNANNQDRQDSQDHSKFKTQDNPDPDPAVRRVLCSKEAEGQRNVSSDGDLASANTASQKKSDESRFAERETPEQQRVRYEQQVKRAGLKFDFDKYEYVEIDTGTPIPMNIAIERINAQPEVRQ